MTVKRCRCIAVNGHVNDVVSSLLSSGHGERLYISMLSRSKPIFGHSLYVLVLERHYRDLRPFQPIGIICGKRCNARLGSGHIWRSWNVIRSGPASLTFMSCRLLPRQWLERTNSNLLRMWLGAVGSDGRLWKRLLPDGRLLGTWQSMQANTTRRSRMAFAAAVLREIGQSSPTEPCPPTW